MNTVEINKKTQGTTQQKKNILNNPNAKKVAGGAALFASGFTLGEVLNMFKSGEISEKDMQDYITASNNQTENLSVEENTEDNPNSPEENQTSEPTNSDNEQQNSEPVNPEPVNPEDKPIDPEPVPTNQEDDEIIDKTELFVDEIDEDDPNTQGATFKSIFKTTINGEEATVVQVSDSQGNIFNMIDFDNDGVFEVVTDENFTMYVDENGNPCDFGLTVDDLNEQIAEYTNTRGYIPHQDLGYLDIEHESNTNEDKPELADNSNDNNFVDNDDDSSLLQ